VSILRAILLSSIMVSSICGVALAQQAGPAPDGPSRDHGRWDPAKMREHEEARHAERDKALHEVLGIQPAQEAAFAAFTGAMKPPEWRRDGGPDADARRGGADEAGMTMTTPQRLDRMKAEMDQRFAAMREALDKRIEATKALYAVLDPRQRAVMDALPELTGRGGGKDHGHRMGPPGPMGPRM
jgi:protein CpxP